MSKTTKNILIFIIIILLILAIAIVLYGSFKPQPMNANTSEENILDNANSGLENFINDIFDENNIDEKENGNDENDNTQNKNTQSKNTQSKNTQAASSSSTSKNNSSSTSSLENQITPGEKKALELAKEAWKKEWGNLNDVSFKNESIQGDGKYIVSVSESKTTKVLRRYVINTSNGVVEEK